MRTINLNSISAFSAVAEYGSYTLAAEKLNCSKAYLSDHVKRLEEAYNTQLLIRTTRKVTLTPAGEAFASRCNYGISQIKEAEEHLINEQSEIRGKIRIASIGGILGENFIAPHLYSFMNIHPGVNIDISFSSDTVDLVAGGYDLAIRFGELRDSSLVAKKLLSYQSLVLATPHYLKTHGTPKSLKDLEDHHLIVGTRKEWEFDEYGKTSLIYPNPKLRCGNGTVMLRATLSHLGLSKLPSIYVKKEIDDGLLIPVLTDWTKKENFCHIIYPPSKFRLNKVQLLVRHLIDCNAHD